MSEAQKSPWTARNKLMEYLARRDHSEKELRQKLRRFFSEDEIEGALSYANNEGWMSDPHEMAERVAQRLDEKGKGALYIRKYLSEKGLPILAIDAERELEKARKLVTPLREAGAERVKLQRHLQNRGYELSTIRELLNEK